MSAAASAVPPPVVSRREHARTLCQVEVSFESDHNFFTGLSENISEGGLFVATHRLLEVGSILELMLTLPGNAQPIRTEAIVRWVRLYSEASDSPPGMGIQFLHLDDAAHAAIRGFVAVRPTLFWE